MVQSNQRIRLYRPNDGGKDVFVHITAVHKAGVRGLKDGQTVEYEAITGKDGRISAENLRVQ